MRLIGLVAAAVAVARPASAGRVTISLDGEWGFKLLAPRPPPSDAGLLTLAAGTIMVPGSWEAQGYGSETATMRWQVLTGENARGKPPPPSARNPPPPFVS